MGESLHDALTEYGCVRVTLGRSAPLPHSSYFFLMFVQEHYRLTGWWDESMSMKPADDPDAPETVLWERTVPISLFFCFLSFKGGILSSF